MIFYRWRRAGIQCTSCRDDDGDQAVSTLSSESVERRLVLRLAGGSVSGDALARELGISRAAVWKRIEALRVLGLDVRARRGTGYALAAPLELLDASAIRAAIPSAVAAELAQLDVAWSLPSTNTALMAAPLPVRGYRVLLAEHQSSGRGRRGRGWVCPLGGQLALSVLRGFDGGLARLGGLGVAVGIAVAEALHAAGFPHIRLKWPNDLVVCGGSGLRKLGGILVEGSGEHGGAARGVVGIGINMRLPETQPDIDQPWIDLVRLSRIPLPSRNALAAVLLTHLLPVLDGFERHGLAPMLERYAALDALCARSVEVHTAEGVHCGIAAGITGDGALRVQYADGERHVHAADISLRPKR